MFQTKTGVYHKQAWCCLYYPPVCSQLSVGSCDVLMAMLFVLWLASRGSVVNSCPRNVTGLPLSLLSCSKGGQDNDPLITKRLGVICLAPSLSLQYTATTFPAWHTAPSPPLPLALDHSEGKDADSCSPPSPHSPSSLLHAGRSARGL